LAPCGRAPLAADAPPVRQHKGRQGGPVRGREALNTFVVAFALVWVVALVAALMMAWKALPLGGARTMRFWRMVFASRPEGSSELSAWWWARMFVAAWALGALMLLGRYVAESRGMLGPR